MRHLHWATRSACALLTAALLTACGSGSTPAASTPDPDPQPNPPAAITGIATPTSVAVVTATHVD